MDVTLSATAVFQVHPRRGLFLNRALSMVSAGCLLAALTLVAWAHEPATSVPTGPGDPQVASPGLILSLAYHPDGELIASGGADGNVRLFDATTGQEIRTLLKHVGRAAGVAYSPDGKSVLSGGDDGGYHLTDGERGGGSNRGSSLPGESPEAVTSVAFCPNGLSFATVSKDQVTLWGPGVGERHALREHTDTVTSAAYSPDCSRIVSGSRDTSVRVWDVVSRQTVLTLTGHGGPVTCVAYSRDGRWIVSGSSDNTLKLWDAKSGVETRTFKGHAEGVNAVAIRDDGMQIASGGDDQAVMLWDIDGDGQPQKIVGHTGEVIAVAFSPDGTRVVSSGKDERAQVWDVRTLRPLVSLGSQDLPVGAANPSRKPVVGETLRGSPDAPQVPVGSNDSGSNDQPLLTIEIPARLAAFPVWSSDSQRIVAAPASLTTKEVEVRVWNADDGTEIVPSKRFGSEFREAVISADGQRVVSFSLNNDRVTVMAWDIDKTTELFRFPLERDERVRLGSVVFSPDGRRFSFGSYDPHVRFFDASTGTRGLTLRSGVRGPAAESVAFSPDGKRIAAGSFGILRIWDAETGQELLAIPRNDGWTEIPSLAFSPDGKRIAAAQSDRHSHTGEIQVWDAAQGTELLTLEGHKKEVTSVAFGPDGTLIASGGNDNTVRLWDAKDGAQIRRYQLSGGSQDIPRDGNLRVAFSPDGKRLAGSERSLHSTIWIWDVRSVAPRPDANREKQAGRDKPPAADPPGRDGLPQPREVPGRNQVARPKGLNIVSRANPTLIVRSKLCPFATLAYSPDGQRIATVSNQTVTIWDAQTWDEIYHLIGHEGAVVSVAFSPDGLRLVSGSKDATLRIWDATNGTEVATLRGHVAEVVCVAVSPDGNQIASGGKDNSIRLWDLNQGTPLSVLNGHRYWINSLAFSPDGQRLVSGSGLPNSSTPAQLKVWSVAHAQELLGLEFSRGAVTNVAFSPDSTRIAAALTRRKPDSTTESSEAKVWDADSGIELFALFEDEKQPVTGLVFSPDGRRIVISANDWSIRFWDAANRVERHRIEYANVQNLVFNPDGKQITGWNNVDIKIWDASEEWLARQRLSQPMRPAGNAARVEVKIPDDRSVDGNTRYVHASDLEWVGQPLMTLTGHVGPVNSVACSPDGRFIVSGSGYPENWLRVWDAATGRLIRILKGHTAPVTKIAFTADGKRVVSASYEPPIIVWDVDSGKELLRIDGQVKYNSGQGFDVSRDGRFIASGGTSPDVPIKLWDAASGKEIRTIAATAIGLALSPDGTRLAFVKGDTITLLDLRDDAKPLIVKGHQSPVESVAFSPNGTLLATWGGKDVSKSGELKLWDAASGQPIRSFTGHTDLVASAAFSPDGKKIVSGGRDRTLKVWDVETGRELQSFKAHGGGWYDRLGVNSVASSPDGRRLLSGGDKEVKMWDAAEVKLVAAPTDFAKRVRSQYRPIEPGHKGNVNCVAFRPDGHRVVSGGSDGTVRVWDTASGKELLTLKAHVPFPALLGVTEVAFSPEGDRLLSCGDRTVKLWNAETGALEKTIQGHTSPVMGAAFSCDGKKIVSVSSQPENTIRVWDAATDQELFARKFVEYGRGSGVAFSPDGTQIVCVSESQSTLFDSTTGAPIRDLPLRGDWSPKVLFSPDGRRVASPLKIAETATGQEILTLVTHTGANATSNVAFSADGKTIACGDGSGALLIWDADSGKELAKIFGNPGPVLGVAFSPDGKFLVTGCAQPGTPPGHGQVKLWDVATGEEVRTFVGLPDPNEPVDGVPPGPRAPARGAPGAPRPALDRNSAERAARAAALKGDWNEAARGYAQMFEIQPIDNGEPGFESAAVLLLSGDRKSYQKRCAELLEKCGTAAIRSYHVARACTLAPDGVEDFAVPDQKAADELKRSREFWSLTEQGALACRAGRSGEAAHLLQQSLKADFRPGTAVLNWLWLALVEHGRGQPAEARAWLRKASEWMDEVSPEGEKMPTDVDGLHLHNWLEALILRRELEALLPR